MSSQIEEHPSLSSVVFDTAGYQDVGVQDGKHIWHTPQGDGVGLFFFPIPPDLPMNACSEEELCQFFSSMMDGTESKLVELHLIAVDGQPSVQSIIKSPQQPTGMTYVGSIIVPFRDFSFVVKVQCQERGMTGMREAMILIEIWAKGGEDRDASGLPVGFSPDDPKYDAKFPLHPLSRLRAVLRHIEKSMRLDATVKQLPSFGLPETSVG
jgi:hypothetical protein